MTSFSLSYFFKDPVPWEARGGQGFCTFVLGTNPAHNHLCIYIYIWLSLCVWGPWSKPEVSTVKIPPNPIAQQREDTYSKSNFPSLISMWPVSTNLLGMSILIANCYLISGLLRPTAP